MATWTSKKSIPLFSLLLFVFVVGALCRIPKDEAPTLSVVEKEELQRSRNSTMAENLEGIEEEYLNEHAVDDPEEVARMVEMWVNFSLFKNS